MARSAAAAGGRAGAGRLRDRAGGTAAPSTRRPSSRSRPHRRARAPGRARSPAEAQPRGEWWRPSPTRCSTTWSRSAAANNTSIQSAAARLAEARARAAQHRCRPRAAGRRWARAPAGRPAWHRNQGTGLPRSITAGVDFSWELDLFGRLSKASDAARLDAESRDGLLQSTRLLVQAETAQTYFALRALDAERALVRETVAAYRDTLRLTAAPLPGRRRRRARRGARARPKSLAPSPKRSRWTGAAPSSSTRWPCCWARRRRASRWQRSDWSTALPAIPAGVPGTVLARRPDVSAAQKAVLAAQARVGVAQTAWFPSISLTGDGGYASSEARRSVQVVGALVGHRRAAVAAALRRRPPRGRRAERQRAAGRRARQLPRAGAGRVQGRRRPALRAAHARAAVGRAGTRGRRRRAGRPRCRIRATATGWSASSTCSTRAAANCRTAARRCRCARRSTRRRWA